MKISLVVALAVIISSCGSKEEKLMNKACEISKLQVQAVYEKDDKKKQELEDQATALSREVEDIKEELDKARKDMTDNEKDEYKKKWKEKIKDMEKTCEREVEDLTKELSRKAEK